MSGDGCALQTDQLTLQTVLQQGYEASARHRQLPDDVRRAVWALLACRTAVLGGHVQAGPEGHVERIWDHSCRHRLCPPCAWVPVERWLAQQKGRLLACKPDHVIFTRPHERHDLGLATGAVRTPVLCASGHETRVELLGDGQGLGATPGILAPLPTWRQTLIRHPPLHGLVTGGGMPAGGPWVPVRNGCVWPRRVVLAVFRGTRLAAIRQGVVQGALQRPAGWRQPPGEHRLNQLGRAQWHGHIRARSPSGPGVLVYLARSWCGGPIAHQRRLAGDGQPVVLGDEERAKGPGGQARHGTVRLPRAPFIGRWRLHVPPPGAVLVRCWGLYAPTQGAAVAMCRQPLGQGPVEGPWPVDGQSACAERGEAPPECWAACGPRLVCTAIIPRAGVPPPAAADGKPVA